MNLVNKSKKCRIIFSRTQTFPHQLQGENSLASEKFEFFLLDLSLSSPKSRSMYKRNETSVGEIFQYTFRPNRDSDTRELPQFTHEKPHATLMRH